MHFSSVKFSWLKMCECKKNDKYQVWPSSPLNQYHRVYIWRKYSYSMFCVLLKDFSRYWLFLCFPQYLEPLEFSDKRSKWIFYLVIFIIIKIRPHGSPGNPSPKYCWSSEAEAPTKAQEGSHHLHPSWRSVKTLWKNGFVIGFFGFFRTRWNVSRTLSNLKDWWSSLLLVANI